MKNIAVLGSTGSIGKNTLDVIRRCRGEFRVAALAARSNTELLSAQIKEFGPEFACVIDEEAAARLRSRLNFNHTEILSGRDGLLKIVRDDDIDGLMLAIPGSDALVPLMGAIEAKKNIALANKEALVAAGPIVMRRLKASGARIIPVDSEQSAIWQCLSGQDKSKLKNIYLTASGGPFVHKSRRELKDIRVADVLRHPRWKMGKKITVDSATLMNKGFEVLEAMYLFDVELKRIKVLIHPEAIVHSMVGFVDGVVLAQLSVTDMRVPIQYALSYPERLTNAAAQIDFLKIKSLNFEKPDYGRFPCLGLAYDAASEGGTMPAVLNAANDVCVNEFLSGRIGFLRIPVLIENVLSRHKNKSEPSLRDIQEADSWARQEAYKLISSKLKAQSFLRSHQVTRSPVTS